jgi:D-alanine-D-alanine ligase
MNVKQRLKNKKIGVLFGGMSAERDISVLTGKAVLKALENQGLNAVGIDAGKDLAESIKKEKINFAYIALHGPLGEDGTVQGLLEVMRIPYSGCRVLSSAIAMNKVFSKRIFDSLNLPTPGWRLFNKKETLTEREIGKLPVVIKPSGQGSAIGVSLVKKRGELKKAVKEAFKYGDEIICEDYIEGTEITVGILGQEALPVIEIVPENKFYDFESKYKAGHSKHIIPPRISRKAVIKSRKLALEAFNALGCRAVSRVDLIVDKKERPWILEVNTIPGMTETSLLPDAARAGGIGFEELVLKILEYSLN